MTERESKKILLISYHFPPSAAVGGVRVASFAKYLRDLGWCPYVLTVKDRYLARKDPARLESLEGIPIVKAGKLVTPRDLYISAKTVLGRWRGGESEESDSAGGGDQGSSSGQVAVQRLKHILASMIYVPDEERNWIIPAALKAIRLLRSEEIDYVLSSCPPYSAHLVGLLASLARPRVKWIADFRDPWMTPTEKKGYPTTPLSNFLDYSLEKTVIQRAALVLATTKKLTEKYAEHYRQSAAEKFRFVPNGFDGDLSARTREPYPVFTISYAGTLYFGRTPEPLFAAVSSLIHDKAVSEEDLCIKLAGHCREIGDRLTVDVAESYGLSNVVEVIDHLPLAASREMVQRSHLALLLAPDQPYQVPAKTYEYIGLGVPILAITGEGATADLVNELPDGKAVSPEDVAALKAHLLDAIQGVACPLPGGEHWREQYARRNAVQGLEQFLHRL
ncbi:glycosyltransferase [Desulfogranum mediterraneum]|uniref:glycosyltransferase n=1 Tax=Desulfogranum mediterraneum TaxID=160661 RepID=UPI0004096BE9|nr:glycosyltransferase [Desulfogranum mediterraneum]